MKDIVVGVHIEAPDAAGLVETIVAAEQAGIEAAWMTSGAVTRVHGYTKTNWTQEGAFQAMSPFLAKEPKLDVIGYG